MGLLGEENLLCLTTEDEAGDPTSFKGCVIGPPKMSTSNPWILRICDFMGQKGACRCDYRSSDAKIILDFTGGPNRITGA